MNVAVTTSPNFISQLTEVINHVGSIQNLVGSLGILPCGGLGSGRMRFRGTVDSPVWLWCEEKKTGAMSHSYTQS